MRQRWNPTGTAMFCIALLTTCAVARAQAPGSPETPSERAEKAARIADALRSHTVSPSKASRPAEEAARLFEAIRSHPVAPSKAARRVAGLFVLEVPTGRVAMVADEPDPGDQYCGSPDWSRDGRRILFDAMRTDRAAESHLKLIEVEEDRPRMKDLGIGNCPTSSPDGTRIAFLNNIGPPTGVWVMLADGTNRKSLGAYGRPRWSPDGRQMMMTSFSSPCNVTMMDTAPERSGPLRIVGQLIYSVPTWAASRTVLAVVGNNDTISLVDTTNPADAKIKEVLWRKGPTLNVTPEYPSYSPATQDYVFVGKGEGGRAFYVFRRGQKEPPRRLEPKGFDKILRDPTFSPDGRFVLFTSDRRSP